jgi:D-lactate dehydrogenase
MKIGFFDIREDEEHFIKSALSENELIFSTDPINESNFSNYPDLEVVSTHTASRVSNTVINGLSNLKFIATRTMGFDHIDTKLSGEKNILISNVPTYGENTVAEFAFGLIFSLARKLPQAIQNVKDSKQFNIDGLLGFDLKGKTIGVIGTGHIGTHVIKIAKGCDMNVVAYDAYPNGELSLSLNFEYKSLEDVLQFSDVISLHVPYLPSTHHLINSQNIHFIKKGAILVNTARGQVIETQALLQALKDELLSGAAMDVLEDENAFKPNANTGDIDPQIIELNKQLMEMPNVYITPHLAFDSKEALQRVLDTTVENIKAFEKNTPINLIKSQN